MAVRDAVFDMIREYSRFPEAISDSSDLNNDLGFDSLSFITLLSGIEAAFLITFDITEMEACLCAGRLAQTVEQKVAKGNGE